MIPSHLQKYVVEQNYERYTPVDQAVWRYVLRQLRAFLGEHAHPCYLEGLPKTGISVERIPRIDEMSARMEKFGWRAVPVSGFIPPAAFMEMQSLGYLPIACDMRTLDHVLYTPAPDIVHEAAGHAPMLADPAYAAYLKQYAQVARRAIVSREDLDQYEAIRELSDLKEDPRATADEIKEAEEFLAEVTASMTATSEAALLGRMNWWTAEYGLIGSLGNPRIFGAGLLSSVGESRSCLSAKVKKIPLSIDCINYAYDITEPQPQLFVTPDFETLGATLEAFAKTMAFRQGGRESVDNAIRAGSVCAVELDSGLQASGVVKFCLDAVASENGGDVAYLQFLGPTQLSFAGAQLPGHGCATHPHGFGSPVGRVRGFERDLASATDGDLRALGLAMEATAKLEFRSGIVVAGRVTGWTRGPSGRLALISFADCTVGRGGETFFRPEWGAFDMAVGTRVVSAFGGPADRERYGDTEDFVAKRVPLKAASAERERKHSVFAAIRAARESGGAADGAALLTRVEADAPDSWLARVEIAELGERAGANAPWASRAREQLANIKARSPDRAPLIDDGLRLVAVP